MPYDRNRRQVVFEAARLIYSRDESQYRRAKIRAAWRVFGGDFRAADLPSDREVREQVFEFARADQRQLDPSQLGRLAAAPHEAPDKPRADRFHVYEMLLRPLEQIKENRQTHPEGDLLYHSLQVFALARDQLPYDEEFLLAALLHDVGKAVDPEDHAAAALAVLDGYITPRTAWLIEHHDDALALEERRLGARSLRRLQTSESFEELMLLARCDRQGRQIGLAAPELEDALDYLRELAAKCGDDDNL